MLFIFYSKWAIPIIYFLKFSFCFEINPNPEGWGHILLPKFGAETTKWPEVKIFFILDLFLTNVLEFYPVNPNPYGYKKVHSRAAGSHTWLPGDQQEAERTLCEIPLPPAALLLVAWESYMTPSWPEYTKKIPKTGGSTYFLIEKLLKI